MSPSLEEISQITRELNGLKQEHNDLDVAIAALIDKTDSDQLQLQRLKKRKLALKDRIKKLENMLTPDIIA
ncbi:DUF465 domain-containing protein [Microvirga sp. W0021]|uniref:DUF465 domain-containing protein n=1 Tax=Hohaiivirga grylli TaxID=3133970 RepID=A0ABV0BJQ5_9HYPH